MVFAPLVLTLASVCYAANLPVVDLGYELHRAASVDVSMASVSTSGTGDELTKSSQTASGIYNFSNIRYAAPPLGDLRFRAPVWPATNRSHIEDGSVGRICPQAEPIWETNIAPAFLMSLMTGSKFNQSTNISSYPYVPEKRDPRTSEDCLFLDVVVPKKIFDRAQNKSFVPKKALAPVLVWIYGGGYTMGEKGEYDPSGLIRQSMAVGEGIIYVAMNYRVSLAVSSCYHCRLTL